MQRMITIHYTSHVYITCSLVNKKVQYFKKCPEGCYCPFIGGFKFHVSLYMMSFWRLNISFYYEKIISVMNLGDERSIFSWVLYPMRHTKKPMSFEQLTVNMFFFRECWQFCLFKHLQNIIFVIVNFCCLISFLNFNFCGLCYFPV